MTGVSYETFWELTPKTLEPFTKAFKLKQEYDDTCAWQFGFYVRLAIGDAFSKQSVYPKKPFYKQSSDDEHRVMSPDEIKMKMLAKINSHNSRKGE